MTDEDLKLVVREFRGAVAEELESVHRRIDEVETGLLNALREVSRRLDRHMNGHA